MKNYIALIFKGIGMGAANVIPGVSGGTIALITGIFEPLIESIKSFNLQALKLLFKGKFKEFAQHINLKFLVLVFLGIGIAIVSIAKLFDYLFDNYPIYIWAFFFGLVLASVYFVAKTITKWNMSTIISFVVGTAIALIISFLKPASEDSSLWYLIICGAVAACSMILPGLSGSFVLILMGNYQLVMINAVNEHKLNILLPVVAGAGVGLVVFSNILSWIFKKFHNQTIAVLSGFIFGSLSILWPWKNPITETYGQKIKTIGYEWLLPTINVEFIIAFVLIVLGILSIWLTEKYANKLAK